MLSAKTQYACLAMLQLAVDYPAGQPVQACRIAEQHGISQTFLVQILHELRRAGLVTSTRGSSGGYQLRRAPSELTLADVVEVFEPLEPPQACATGESPFSGLMLATCCKLQNSQRELLEQETLAELAERSTATEPMWYI